LQTAAKIKANKREFTCVLKRTPLKGGARYLTCAYEKQGKEGGVEHQGVGKMNGKAFQKKKYRKTEKR